MMNRCASPVRRSYLKTTVACLVVAGVAFAFSLLGLYWLPTIGAIIVVVLSVLLTMASAILACAGAIVLCRQERAVAGKRDLFLHLNRSREPAAISAAAPVRLSSTRRWLVRHLLGHGLVVGDLVEVKTWAEIRETLDERGCLDDLPFMPEMLAMCGRGPRFSAAYIDFSITERLGACVIWATRSP